MRSVLTLALSALIFASGYSCTTSGASSNGPTYDGTADDMDSLPDCGPETQGSLFWVVKVEGAFECGKTNQWAKRKNAKKPDDVEESSGEDAAAVSPRIVK